ncbi:hypothetical protein [Actinomadura sp. 9N215]|uniref:hypothetical protein n=1 Tax=Actinomadura sp. 9N215 TaxID=3375150 RepID=UPI0037933B54
MAVALSQVTGTSQDEDALPTAMKKSPSCRSTSLEARQTTPARGGVGEYESFLHAGSFERAVTVCAMPL